MDGKHLIQNIQSLNFKALKTIANKQSQILLIIGLGGKEFPGNLISDGASKEKVKNPEYLFSF